jgi:hypothetical protein
LGLYSVTLPQLAALAAVEVVGPPNVIRAVARCVLTLATFLGMAWWVRSSRPALDLQQWCECAPRTLTIRVVESRRPDPCPPVTLPTVMPVEADEDALVRT